MYLRSPCSSGLRCLRLHWFVYKAFGLGGAKAVAVITLQAVIAVSVDMLPLPGGMGISEKLFAMIFIPVFGKRLLCRE